MKDDLSVSDNLVADSTSGGDSTSLDDNQDPSTLAPQENIVAAVITNISLAQTKMTWKNEISGNAITRDRRSPEWEQKNYPNFLKKLFTPRLSTGVDYAVSSEISLNLSKFSLKGVISILGPDLFR